jgi:hypothetical protein
MHKDDELKQANEDTITDDIDNELKKRRWIMHQMAVDDNYVIRAADDFEWVDIKWPMTEQRRWPSRMGRSTAYWYTFEITSHYDTTDWRRKCSYEESEEKNKRRRSRSPSPRRNNSKSKRTRTRQEEEGDHEA